MTGDREFYEQEALAEMRETHLAIDPREEQQGLHAQTIAIAQVHATLAVAYALLAVADR